MEIPSHRVRPNQFTPVLRAGLALSVLLSAHAMAADLGRPPLRIMGPEYPRVFFFRAAESGPSRPNTVYERWDAEFSRLMGIMGKCLDEEVVGREAHNAEFFTRFKKHHPEQLVLLHFNGNSRDPRFRSEHYFAGHWVYRRAVRILSDVPAEDGETTIKVANAAEFRMDSGRYRTANDDIGLFGTTADGKHDWSHCEQVRLVSVDLKADMIRVKRGCYGTRPLAFRAGIARAAAHMTEGPWGKPCHLLWYYNYSTHCPRDAQGRSCADRLVDDLASWFGEGGQLAAFDGLEFDVLFHETHGDTNGDGEADNGVVDGRNQYGIGVIEFLRQLRHRLGDSRIIQADGALGPGGIRSQRGWGLLNGIESEGWPNLNEWEMKDWSGGLNRHTFWQANARAPAFNYINHKWVEPVPGKPGEQRNVDVPFGRHRLVFAAAQFTDAMVCYSNPPARGSDGMIGIWDEFCRGVDNQLGWLGRPQGEAVHLAAGTPNQLSGINLAQRIRGAVTVDEKNGQWIIRSQDPTMSKLAFSIPDIAVQGDDLVVLATMKGESRRGYPREMARFVQVEAGIRRQTLTASEPEQTGICQRGKTESPLDPDTGARVTYSPKTAIAGRPLASYAIHPPYQTGGVGYVYWYKDVDLSPATELRFHVGMGEKSPARSDGVWFQVWIAELTGGQPGVFRKIFERSTKAHTWMPCSVSLESWAGKRVRLKFVADCGPQNNATTDHGFWGDVRLVATAASPSADAPGMSAMTWMNERPFTSTFYFRELRAAKVNLSFEVEGPEPVTLQAISAHLQGDAVYRVFENGIVLANPSLKPYTFDLAALSPGRKYRRLQASPNQDLAANNGAAVGDTITLGERDALFLVRVH